jgi:hypothetical protein
MKEMKETPRRRITVTSSLNKIFTDQLGNREGVRRYSAINHVNGGSSTSYISFMEERFMTYRIVCFVLPTSLKGVADICSLISKSGPYIENFEVFLYFLAPQARHAVDLGRGRTNPMPFIDILVDKEEYIMTSYFSS